MCLYTPCKLVKCPVILLYRPSRNCVIIHNNTVYKCQTNFFKSGNKSFANNKLKIKCLGLLNVDSINNITFKAMIHYLNRRLIVLTKPV